MRRILITGAAGFLGSHLCDRILALGYELVALDDFSTGSRRNIEHLSLNPAVEVIEHDVSLAMEFNVDGIFNLACPASPIQYQKNPVKTVVTNVLGAINVLNLAKERGVRVFQASTSEVYGDPDVHPQTEGYWGRVNPIGPRACYDEGKRCAETLFFDYHREHGVDIKVGRIFNTYGPRMDQGDGRVVSNFITQALRGEDLTIYGDGSQTRSFCYVDDLIDGILRLMFSEYKGTGPINLGNPNEITMVELAETVLKIANSTKSRIDFRPLPKDDPRQRRPDITLAKQQLGWTPKVSLEEGLTRTTEYFRELLGL